MNQSLLKLVEMQEVDLRIHELDVSSYEFPEQVAAIEAELRAATEAIEASRQRAAQVEQDKKAAQDAIAEGKAALERSQSRLSSITTNREYDAVHAEITTNQQVVGNGEKRLVTLDEDGAKAKEDIEQAEGHLAKLQEEQGPLLEELRAKIASIDGQRQALVAQRTKISEAVSPQFLRTYEHILKHRKSGVALSYVDEHEKTCAVCHRVLEPQRANELQSAKRLTICESCGSILVWKGLPGADSTAAAPAPDARQ